MARRFTKYPSSYVRANMTFKRRGRFLDSADGRWVICKHEKNGRKDRSYYYVLDKTTQEYLTDDDGKLAWWYNLKDAKAYIEYCYGQSGTED